MEVRKAWTGTGTFRWTELTPMQNPRQYHIISALATLPVKKMTRAILAEGEVVIDTLHSRVLE